MSQAAMPTALAVDLLVTDPTALAVTSDGASFRPVVVQWRASIGLDGVVRVMTAAYNQTLSQSVPLQMQLDVEIEPWCPPRPAWFAAEVERMRGTTARDLSGPP